MVEESYRKKLLDEAAQAEINKKQVNKGLVDDDEVRM